MGRLHTPRHGRHLDDFEVGATYRHPWEVTVDEGLIALYFASFQDALPTYASRPHARALGLRDRPVHPMLLLNLALSMSVHDVSEQAIAHLAYLDVRFPAACYPGDTVVASSRVLGARPVSTGDKGVVHVRTVLETEAGLVVCTFERKALLRGGRLADRPRVQTPTLPLRADGDGSGRLPVELAGELPPPWRPSSFPTYFEDLEPGDVYAHAVGHTVGASEHVALTTLLRNSHPLHFDELYCRDHSFARARVVYGGLVLSFALALQSRDVAGNAVWDLGLDDGAHPSGVLAGDTLYAATKVLQREDLSPWAGAVKLRVVAVKNESPRALLERGADLFTPELDKKEGKVPEKVVEVTRTLLVRRRPGGADGRAAPGERTR